MANFTEERGNMASMNIGNLGQASAPRFALIFVTENRKPKTENPGPEAL